MATPLESGHPLSAKYRQWHIFDRLTEKLYALSQTLGTHVSFAPLYIHSFQADTPKKIVVVPYADMETPADRLRWLRRSKELSQVQFADKLGVSLNRYKAMEAGQPMKPNEVRVLEGMFSVTASDFLDAFHQFLYDGQAARIRAYRESFGMGKKPFAREMGIPVRCLQEWESERKVISIKCWERYFKGRA